MMTTGIRINKAIADTGYCSRRQADDLIESGQVTINGIVATLGSRVQPGDQISIAGKPLTSKPKTVYLAFHKPVGITCTTDRKIAGNIIDYINYPERIFPIGRLDKPSEGLILLTNDGDIVNKILRASNNHEKEYIVSVDKPITQDFIDKMGNGVPILGTMTNKCIVEQLNKRTFKIILTQGLNRQIRRMCEYFDYNVTALKRVRIMNILLDTPVGEWRYLTEQELERLSELIGYSSKTEG